MAGTSSCAHVGERREGRAFAWRSVVLVVPHRQDRDPSSACTSAHGVPAALAGGFILQDISVIMACEKFLDKVYNVCTEHMLVSRELIYSTLCASTSSYRKNQSKYDDR